MLNPVAASRFVLRAASLTLALAVLGCGRLDPQKELATAAESLSAGRYNEAAIRLNNVVQLQPDNIEARRLRGELELRAGYYASAAEDLERAKKLGAPLDSVAVSLADAWITLGRAEEALGLLDSAAEGHSSDAMYWTVRALALLRMGRTVEAESALDAADRSGGGTRAAMARATWAMARDDSKTAEDVLVRALASAPDDASLLVARADLFAHTNRLTEAATDLSRAGHLYATSLLVQHQIETLLTLVQVQLARNDLEAAAAAAAQLVQLAPQAAMTAYYHALVEYRRGHFDEAAALVQPLASASPDTPQFTALLGAIHLARGELGQAEQQLLTVLRKSPRDPAAIKLLAETRLRQQRPDAALAVLRSVEDVAAEDPQIGLLNGLASLQAGKTEQALVYLQRAAALDPTNELLKLQLARAYLAAGRDADASAALAGAFGADAPDLEAGLLKLFADTRLGARDAGDEVARDLLERFPAEPRALTAVALHYQLRGEAPRARELFEKAAKLETNGSTARMFVAAAWAQEGRREEAERLLTQVVEQRPDDAQALGALAQLALARGAVDQAAEHLRAAAEHSSSVSPRLTLAQLWIRQGDFAAAKEQLDVAAKAAPDNPEVGAVSGLLALAEGRAADAVALLKKAASQLPDRLGVALALARAQLAIGSPDAARATVRGVLAVAPRSLPLRFILAEAELRLGNVTEAYSIGTALKADYPTQSAGWVLLAETQITERRYSAAADNLIAAFERDPTWPVLTRLIGALQLAGRNAEALGASEKWATANPKDVPGALAYAALLENAGRKEDALRGYQTVLGLDGSNVVALNNAAWLTNDLARPGALALAERAHDLAADNPAVLDTLGWILLTEKREPEAVSRLSRAVELAPDALEIRYHFGKALAAAGQSAEARSVLNALVNDSRDFAQRPDARRLLESL